MAQVERIQKEVYDSSSSPDLLLVWRPVFPQIAESAPLVGEREDLSCLETEYAKEDTVYQAKIQASPLVY